MTYDPRYDAPAPLWFRRAVYGALAIGCTVLTTISVTKPGPVRQPETPAIMMRDTPRDLSRLMIQPKSETVIPVALRQPIVDGLAYDTIPDTPEILILTALGWGEARGECKGQSAKCLAAVMHVAMNRLESGKWGQTLEDVAFAPYQFSALNQRDVNLRKIAYQALTGGDADWKRAKEVAYKVIKGQIKDPTGGALFYHERTINPRWNAKMKRTAVVGSHIFYRGKI